MEYRPGNLNSIGCWIVPYTGSMISYTEVNGKTTVPALVEDVLLQCVEGIIQSTENKHDQGLPS